MAAHPRTGVEDSRKLLSEDADGTGHPFGMAIETAVDNSERFLASVTSRAHSAPGRLQPALAEVAQTQCAPNVRDLSRDARCCSRDIRPQHAKRATDPGESIARSS